MRTCIECGADKPVAEFPESHPGKPRTRCGPCYRKYQARVASRYYHRHHTERLAAASTYRDENRTAVRERNRLFARRRRQKVDTTLTGIEWEAEPQGYRSAPC